MLLDREGCLWCSTYQLQFPEPETVLWTVSDGLPFSPRRLLLTDEGLWVSTWSGLGRLARVGNQWRASNEGIPSQGDLCVDRRGVVWARRARWQGQWIKQDYGGQSGCAPANDGTVWIINDRSLLRTHLGAGRPRSLGQPPDEATGQVLQDKQGRLWLAGGNRICHAPAAAVNVGCKVDWNCQTLAGALDIYRLLQLPSGSLWAASFSGGVWRYANGSWQVIPSSQKLPGRRASALVLSPSGGLWVGGFELLRVKERLDLPDGWEVVERLSSWHGLRGAVLDLIEEPDGSLWIVTIFGVVRMPAAVRRAPIEPPRVKLVDLVINGQHATPAESPRIPAGRNQIELRFAALTFRDRSLLRYQYRLRPGEPWTEVSSGAPVLRFFDLASGQYTVEMRASLDGVRWSPETAPVSFEVLPAWYLRWWALTLLALLTGGAAYAAYRARVAVLLRLERQRARIARDLHDELGAGLGSIGILSGVAADEQVNDAQRRTLSRQIAEAAGELGTVLSDIVWTLRADSNTIEGLALHLARRAHRLFPNEHPQLTLDLPAAWPLLELTPAVRRNLFLIAVEAMHNAARHARASHVVLGFAPAGRQWRLWMSDDGCGLGGNGNHHGGTGLLGLRQRAAEIGAEPAWGIVLMDIELPGLNGIEATRQLKQRLPRLPVVVLTVFEEPATILEAITAGADGYLLKKTSAPEMLSQLRNIVSGGSPLTSFVARTVLDLLRAIGTGGAGTQPAPFSSPTKFDLTDREQEVLQCLVRGMSYKQAADQLSIRLDTVRTHIRGIYKKLQVHSVSEAVARAIRERLV